MLNESDVFSIEFAVVNKTFKNVIVGHGFRTRCSGIFQVVQVPSKSYQATPLFSRQPLAEVKHRTIPRQELDLLMASNSNIQFVSVIPPEEVAKLLLIH